MNRTSLDYPLPSTEHTPFWDAIGIGKCSMSFFRSNFKSYSVTLAIKFAYWDGKVNYSSNFFALE